jgi:hypothetical protein
MMVLEKKQTPLVRFLTERQTHSDLALEVVRPVLMGGGVENECLKNATMAQKNYGLQMVSGWLYIPTRKQKIFQFTQHWWNYDSKNETFYDYSPNIESNSVHILDLSIAIFSMKKFGYLTVAKSILIKSNNLYTVEYSEEGYAMAQIEDLNPKSLFPPRDKHGPRIE